MPPLRFWSQKDSPGAYTMALEEAFDTAASGYTEAVTEFHIVGGLHPDLPFQYFLDLCSGLSSVFRRFISRLSLWSRSLTWPSVPSFDQGNSPANEKLPA